MKLKLVAVLAALFLVAAMLIPGGSSVNVQKIYEEAEVAFQEKRYQEAIDKYNQAILEGEKWGANTKVIDEDFDSLAKYKIAVCYSELGKQREDPVMYEESMKYIPPIYEKTTVAKVREGLIFLWGHNLFQLQRYEEAEPKFRELLNDYPDSQFVENAYYYLGNLYYELKQYESSREAFLMILNKFPNSTYIDDSQFFIARCFYDEANYDQAYIEYSKVQSDDQSLLAQARYYAGISLINMGRNQDALTSHQKFIADFPNSVYIPAAYYDMGSVYTKLKEYDEATRNYQLAIQNTKDEITRSEIQFQIGNNYFAQEDFQAAISAYQTLMETYPQSVHIPEARLLIAEAFWWLKDYANALTAYAEVLETDQDTGRIVTATYKTGECHYQLGDKEVALEWYQKVIDNYPDSPTVKDAIYGKIWSLNDLKRYEEAEQVARDYINKYKTDRVYDLAAAETQMMLGDIKFDAENYIAAADEYLLVASDYSDLPKFDPFKSRSLLQAGFAYYKEAEKNNWDLNLLSKAAESFDRLVTQFEKNFDKEKRDFQARLAYVIPGIINLGLSYKEMKEFDKARAALDIMPKQSEEYGRAMFLKGETYTEEEKLDEAIAIYRKMINDKTITESWRSRAAIELASQLSDTGRHEEAATEYQRIATEYPTSEFAGTAMYYVGSSYYDIEPKTPENMQKAIDAFKKMLEKYPDSEVAPWAHFGIARAYETIGSYDMVIKTADEIESIYADSKIPDARKVIDLARREKVDAMSKLEEGVSADALIAEYRKVVNDPVGEVTGKISAQARIGSLLYSEKRYEESIKEYEDLLQKHPEGDHTGSAYYQIAVAAYALEDYQKTAENAKKGLEKPDLKPEIKVYLSYTLGLANSRLGNANDAIEAFKVAIQASDAVEDKEKTADTILAAHREMARAYVTAKQYNEAVNEYKFLTGNLKTDEEKSEVYFWLARVYEENLQDYQNAVDSYKKAIELGADDVLLAQSLYYSGIIYSKNLADEDSSLASLQELANKFGDHTDSNVQMMVSDANLRIPELLIKLGKYDDAVARAKDVRDKAVAGANKEDMINAQYQLAFLLGEQATETSDPDLSIEAASEYAKVYDIAKPTSELSENLKTLVGASLYNAGYLRYGLGAYENYAKALEYFDTFTREFPKNENYSPALEYLGFAAFEMARLKADLNMYDRAGDYFARFAREFPSHKDAAVAQYQAGESYFAVAGGHSVRAEEARDAGTKSREVAASVAAYRKAITAYRAVADKYRNSEYAPDSLYAIAASHSYIAEALTNPTEKQREASNALAAYKDLAARYPTHEHAGSAFLSIANDYYNQAAAPGVPTTQKTNLYKLSIENYKKALAVPGIESKVKANVELYIKETEELLAKDNYDTGYSLVPFDADLEKKKANAPRAIQYFRTVIDTMPNTDYADLSYVQLGLCYEYLERWKEAEDAYTTLINKYTDRNGRPIIPASENVVQAVSFARDRKGKIMAYRLSLEVQKSGSQ